MCLMLKNMLLPCCVLLVFFWQTAQSKELQVAYYSTSLQKADKVVVQKTKRLLTLYANDEKIKSYRINLGANPIGHKKREGDSKTPEGEYTLDWRNPNSSYYLSLHVSYPDQQDVLNASERGVSAGNNIMIHGQPNSMTWRQYKRLKKDWTDGCIAVLNHEMQEIWETVPDGTKIIILP